MSYTIPLGRFAAQRHNRPAPGEVVTTSRVQWADAEVPISPAQKWNQVTLLGKRVRPPATPHAEALRLRKLGTFARREQATWLRNAALNLENGKDYSWCLVTADKYAQKREIVRKANADIAAVDGGAR